VSSGGVHCGEAGLTLGDCVPRARESHSGAHRLFKSMICTECRRNPATCATNQGARPKVFAPTLRAGAWGGHRGEVGLTNGDCVALGLEIRRVYRLQPVDRV